MTVFFTVISFFYFKNVFFIFFGLSIIVTQRASCWFCTFVFCVTVL